MKSVQQSQLETENNVTVAREHSKALRCAFIKRMDEIDADINNIYAFKTTSLQNVEKDLKNKLQLLQTERNDLKENSPSTESSPQTTLSFVADWMDRVRKISKLENADDVEAAQFEITGITEAVIEEVTVKTNCQV